MNDDDDVEKVSQKFATVRDLEQHVKIELRKAAQLAAEANELAQVLDEARRRAGGNDEALLRDLMDDSGASVLDK